MVEAQRGSVLQGALVACHRPSEPASDYNCHARWRRNTLDPLVLWQHGPCNGHRWGGGVLHDRLLLSATSKMLADRSGGSLFNGGHRRAHALSQRTRLYAARRTNMKQGIGARGGIEPPTP